ncbi:LysM peptidoglycan-binding domain-containing protein [Vibrio algivorus]|uniref:LysM peptidoglycan-binding domain-containing protein n=1 Tax=Vibrio algivorus TaxID=1667024 RepID=A0A557NX88_9VIBR|nr:LysM peptidoglycan-binding domain-containing protein [Vibrio algivorus]TVO33019.1 LysM peptidoglycan-binding domain-containing protein [Vibrio algivorus]GLT14235.1 peptidoglycan-binding protein LysM [Vibrio algivorus]
MLKSNPKIITLTMLASALALSGCASNDEVIEQQNQQAEQLNSLQVELQAQKESNQQLADKVDQLSMDQDEIKQQMQDKSSVYVIKENDTLYRIANDHDMTVDELQQLNPEIKNPKSLLIGQTIKLK